MVRFHNKNVAQSHSDWCRFNHFVHVQWQHNTVKLHETNIRWNWFKSIDRCIVHMCRGHSIDWRFCRNTVGRSAGAKTADSIINHWSCTGNDSSGHLHDVENSVVHWCYGCQLDSIVNILVVYACDIVGRAGNVFIFNLFVLFFTAIFLLCFWNFAVGCHHRGGRNHATMH